MNWVRGFLWVGLSCLWALTSLAQVSPRWTPDNFKRWAPGMILVGSASNIDQTRDGDSFYFEQLTNSPYGRAGLIYREDAQLWVLTSDREHGIHRVALKDFLRVYFLRSKYSQPDPTFYALSVVTTRAAFQNDSALPVIHQLLGRPYNDSLVYNENARAESGSFHSTEAIDAVFRIAFGIKLFPQPWRVKDFKPQKALDGILRRIWIPESLHPTSRILTPSALVFNPSTSLLLTTLFNHLEPERAILDRWKRTMGLTMLWEAFGLRETPFTESEGPLASATARIYTSLLSKANTVVRPELQKQRDCSDFWRDQP